MGKREFVHVELPTQDGAAMRKFYGDIFGWEFSHMDSPEYWSFATDGLGGGLSEVNDQVKPGDVLLYIGSEDIEADLKAIQATGGQVVMPKTEIPTIGWMAMFSDPTGNVLGLYSPMEE